ncbi:MFS transporter [Pseudonocardia sulfidoxydans]|nr:MFS transporter [Pseudonocardia sulfidoxydans]
MSSVEAPPELDDRGRTVAVAAMTFATGAIVANLYYAQPLEATLAEHFGASTGAVGAALTVIQVAYAVGLATVVPLGDLLQRRRLVVGVLGLTVAGLVVAASAPSLAVLGSAFAVIGVTAVAAQVLVPFAAQLARPGEQGRTVGTVMSGLLIGVLVARVVSGLVADWLGWRAVFVLAAVLTAVCAFTLWRTLPVVAPSVRASYPRLLGSVLGLVRDQPVLRLRMVYGATSYASFGALWTSIGFLLAGPPFDLSDAQIGLFALFGVAGALMARFAGRLADRGLTHPMTGAALASTAASFVLVWFGAHSLVVLAVGIVVFDLALQGCHITNQSVVFALAPEARSRLNTAYMTSYFVGGATGSGLSAALYAAHGWTGVVVVGAAFPTLGFLVWLGEAVARARTGFGLSPAAEASRS